MSGFQWLDAARLVELVEATAESDAATGENLTLIRRYERWSRGWQGHWS